MAHQLFNSKQSQYQAQFEYHDKRFKAFSLFRGLTFIAGAYLIISYFQTDRMIYLASFIASSLLFYALVMKYRAHHKARKFAGMLSTINEEELLRLDLKLEHFPPGKEYQDDHHPYTTDLDVFGNHSLFQLLNRTSLTDARELLAGWMQKTVSATTILERQSTIKALTPNIDWLQKFQAISRLMTLQKKKNKPQLNAEHLATWTSLPTSFHSRRKILFALGVLGVLSTLITSLLIFSGGYPYQIIYLSVVFNILLLSTVIRSLTVQSKGLDEADYLVKSYKGLIAHILTTPAQNGRVAQIRQQLEHSKALAAINELQAITARINTRANIFFILLDVLFVLDVFILLRLEKWKILHRDELNEWLDLVHETEAYVSLAAHAAANSEDTYPSVTEQWNISAQQLKHPLMHPHQAVSNEFDINQQGSLDIITGSNMSGKSTFQRTLGTNLLLGHLGLPTKSKSLTFKPLQIFTSMRTRDNLSENTSSFYAELKRLQHLLQLLKGGNEVCYLLDEILKGTNSQDRHIGAVGLIEKLVNTTSMGLISTHDLALAKIAEQDERIRNFSFNSSIEGSKIHFDYKLTPGACKSFNAAQLMKNMGILN
ncbi:MutS-related protein [Marinoscillum furvescens]|uniref:MutS-like protein n=1 Tax=Marinoscillum furvescens DSM 4134 TaxID=1122208 RepID=A0A3D9L283_MARFU|nr:hypothetical protein [Marinoscillum furvescens]RED97494.1 MutS-like protein [Marinoscillum furvescens DSM 4134]